MIRRRVLLLYCACLLAGAMPAVAQPPARVWQVGLLHVGNDHMPPSYRTLVEGMAALGYRDGGNIRYDFRNVPDERSALEAARALVRERVDVIVAFDQEACAAARAATATLPIVMMHTSNPLAAGFATSLARPGGNMTGFAGRAELPAKELEILKDLAPKLRRLLLLFDSGDPASLGWREDTRKAARNLGVTLVERDVTDPSGLKAVFDTLKPGDAEAVLFASNVIRHRYQSLVLPLATQLGMAMVGSRKDVVEKGALFSYSYDFTKIGRVAASRYLEKILKGVKPGELAIEEVTEYELVVNRRVAMKHGWPVPQSILLRAERIID